MLVDDHRLLVETLAGAMKDQDDLEVVGTASTATEALRAALDAAPDVVLLDLRLDNQDTVDLIPRLVSVPSRPKVVVLSAARDRRHAARALEAGAVGYLTKQQPLQELFAAFAPWSATSRRSTRPSSGACSTSSCAPTRPP